MKHGFLLSLDAIVAITLLLTVSLFLAGISFTYSTPELRYQRYYYAGKDIVALFQEAKMSSVSDVVDLAKYNLTQEEMNRTILDVIGSFWAGGNMSVASNLTMDIFSEVLGNTGLNYEVSFNDETIYASNESYSDFIARLSTVVSGYEKTKPVNGYLAKVYVTKVSKTNSEFIYFGGYEGDGNITKVITLPVDVNVTGAYLEMNVGSDFMLYINDQPAGTYSKNAANFSADNWTICSKANPAYCSYFAAGQNIIQLNFTMNQSTYVGGGYLKVTYKTSELTEYTTSGNASDYYEFPGIRGIINLYSSFYVPGTLKNMSARLHYNNNLSINGQGVPVYFVIGSKEIYRSNATGEHIIEIPEKNISDAFGGKVNLTEKLSNATIPIRFGTDTFAFTSGEGTSDSILITDVSGSMGSSCDVESSACLHTDCNAASGCQNYRIDVAKDVDKNFVSMVLNYTGNRLGLVSYTTSTERTHSLSNSSVSLNDQIVKYTDIDNTCISCGIADATSMLQNDTKAYNRLIAEKAVWLYNMSFPNETPPIINGTSWNEHNYTDTGWDEGQAILGFGSVDTDIGNNGGDYYFRKHFNISNVDAIETGELYVLSDDNAEIYLNGHIIDNDTQQHNGQYWNRGGQIIFSDNFESYYSTGQNRLYSNEINTMPGYWIVNGTPSADKEVFIMADVSMYPASSGNDVLVFRDMDSYGYAGKKINLTGEENLMLSYWWRMGPNSIESGEYANVQIWDGTWKTARTYNSSQFYGPALRDEINLSGYNMINNFTIRFGLKSSDDDERFYIDDVEIKKKVILVNNSYFKNGDNVIAVKLHNDDSANAGFDLALNVTSRRYKAMLVMSDGLANSCLPGVETCSNYIASSQAILKACEARDNFSINVYTVGFGSGANMTTLSKIACWNCSANNWISGCSRYYNSTNADELEKIYRDIARDIANASYAGQLFNFTGNISLNNVLYTDSYIYFNYTPVVRTPEYGEITLNFESPRLGASTGTNMITDNETGTKEGWFFIPGDTEVSTELLDSKITSYSSYYWTDRLWVNSTNTPNQNWTRVYWLANYSSDYEKLGDPYIVQIPPNLLTANGNNSFKIGTGLRPTPLSGGKGASPDDRVIYTLGIKGISLTQYSDVFAKAKGSTVTIYYDANGDNVADSSTVVEIGPDPDDVFDPMNDSIDNGFMNSGIVDLNYTSSGPSGTGDGSSINPIDLEITEDVNFNSDFISQISSMWGPAIMEVKIWG